MKKTLALLMCFILCLSTACKKENVLNGAMTLYFVDAEKKNMVTEQREIKAKTTEEMLMAVINELIKGPENKDYKKAIPDGTKLLRVEFSENIATIDLSEQFNTGSKLDKLWGRYTIINTLCGIQGVEKVQILVEGNVITSVASNTPLGPVGKDDIVTDVSQIINDEVTAKLYFADEQALYLVAETRIVAVKEGEKLEKVLVEELFKGPKDSALIQTLPAEVKVLSTETKDGVCFVNLSAEFATAKMGTSGEGLAVYSIVNTLCELKDVDGVQILVEGKKIKEYGHINLSETLEKNDNLLK